MYKSLRNLLFLLSPESAHYISMKSLKVICNTCLGKSLVKAAFQPKSIQKTQIAGLQFPNRVGLAAGFDKNANYLTALEALGFGHVEIGTVTPLAQSGNPKPRLFRLKKDEALINRMGFNNEGATAIAARLADWRKKNPNTQLLIGGNIGKNKVTPNENAWMDYEKCFEALHAYVDYFIINVSSPNTPGLRELQEKDSLKKIFASLQENKSQQKNKKPLLLKIAPDLTNTQVDEVIDLAIEMKLDGLVISNTTISRENLLTNQATIEKIGAGGLSGKPVKEKSTALLKYVSKKTNNSIPLIASGGIMNAEDAKEKIEAGATLVQIWTGFIYNGPGLIKSISSKLN
jgi:dihydroorotate dehydrogenase